MGDCLKVGAVVVAKKPGECFPSWLGEARKAFLDTEEKGVVQARLDGGPPSDSCRVGGGVEAAAYRSWQSGSKLDSFIAVLGAGIAGARRVKQLQEG